MRAGHLKMGFQSCGGEENRIYIIDQQLSIPLVMPYCCAQATRELANLEFFLQNVLSLKNEVMPSRGHVQQRHVGSCCIVAFFFFFF